MKGSEIQRGAVQANWNVAGTRILKYTVEIYHKGLKEHKLISAPDQDILENKVKLQEQKWTEKWNKLEEKLQLNQEKEANIEEANARTNEAIEALSAIDNLLIHTLSIDDKVDWTSLKQNDKYAEELPTKPVKAALLRYPASPDISLPEYIPKYSLWEKLFKTKKLEKDRKIERKLANAFEHWENEKNEVDRANEQIDNDYKKRFIEWQQAVTEWEKRKDIFQKQQNSYNLKIDQMKKEYLSKKPDSIVEYCELVLNNSVYPDSFPKNFELEYNPENKILIIEYELPTKECFPNVKEVKYMASRKELKESYIPETQISKMFDEAIYKIALRTIHEIFEADVIKAIDAISFNGWVNATNRATGRQEDNCIISIHTNKNEFITIDLGKIDPKTCFKNLKGVAGSRLSSLTPVQPIMQICRTDRRFVEGYDVAHGIDSTTNLAAMDWEDFEHLIRELFEKEFIAGGGEVKVTQASRDGGVDAIAFDPDPIRGGKIVIQAKRYTNTVGVSSVRDLYGTVLNEGATKGILVSTADYGADAYEFAKGKPITLLNGSNLLHLLEKHGHHAKIDIREAKKILAERQKQPIIVSNGTKASIY